MDFEFPRNRVRLVNILGSGEFGEVWQAQAYQIDQLRPRDKSAAASKARQKMRSEKRVIRKIDKHLEKGLMLQLVAVKKLTGNNLFTFINFR